VALESGDHPSTQQRPFDRKDETQSPQGQPAGTPIHSESDELVNKMLRNLTENNANPDAMDAKRAARDARTKPAFPAIADEQSQGDRG